MVSIPSCKTLLNRVLNALRRYCAKVAAMDALVRSQHEGDAFEIELGFGEIFHFMLGVAGLLDQLDVLPGVWNVLPAASRDGGHR